MARADSKQKQKILDAAIFVFAGHGLDGATTRMLARQAGLNSALIYYYFENKQALFAETVHTALQRFFGLLQQRPKSFATGRDRLAFLVNNIFDYAAAHPEFIRLVSLAFNLHPELFAKAVNALLADKLPYPLKVLKDGVDQGQLRPLHPIQIWWQIVGVCLFSLKLRDVVAHVAPAPGRIPLPDLDNQRPAIVESLVHGLAAPARGKSRSRPRSTQS